MERIESTKNPHIKAAKALHTVKGRNQSGMFLCEGEHMVSEAIRAIGDAYVTSSAFTLGSVFAMDTLFVQEGCEEQFSQVIEEARAVRAFLVPAHVLQAVSTVKSPQGIAAVVRLQVPPVNFKNVYGMLEQKLRLVTQETAAPADAQEVSPVVPGDTLVLMENVQDPGNVGAILRTMDAAGFSGAVLSPGCADPFSPKALRASMGSVFRVPTQQVESAAETAAALAQDGYAVVAALLDGTDFYARPPLPAKVCLIIGNEGAGITGATLAAATHRYRLPMRGGAESLNAAAAAAIMIYEIAYRR